MNRGGPTRHMRQCVITPALVGLSPHEDLQCTPSACQTRPAVTHTRQEVDELSKGRQRTGTGSSVNEHKARKVYARKLVQAVSAHTSSRTPRVLHQVARMTLSLTASMMCVRGRIGMEK